MPTISSGSSQTFTAGVKDQLFTLTANGGALGVVTGAASASFGPGAERRAFGPFAVGQAITVTVQAGSVIVEYGDASPESEGAVTSALTGEQINAGAVDVAGLTASGVLVGASSIGSELHEATLAVCGTSIERLGFTDLSKRFDCTAGTWSAGVASLTASAHGITVGTQFPVDVYDHSGGAWGALGVTATATDANTIAYPLPVQPAAIAGTVAINVRVDLGIPITSATWSAGTATLTVPIPLGLAALPAPDYRIALSNVRDASGNALAEYNGVSACAPLSFPSNTSLTFYTANDPGAAAASGTITFVPQFLAGVAGWPQALNRILGGPFRFVQDFAIGGATPVGVAKQVDQVCALATKPTHCLFGGVENDPSITAVETFRTAGRKLRDAGIVPILFDARPVALFSSAAALFDAYQQDLADMCAAEGFLLLTGGNVYQRAGTAPVADQYTDTAWKIAPPTIDGTHPSRAGAYQLAQSLADSDGGRKLAALARRQFAMLGGGTSGNLLPNPAFLTPTGGALGGGTGSVPSGYEIFGDNTSCVCVPIKRSAPRKWLAGMIAAIGDVVYALTRSTPWLYVATAAGTAGGAEPTWPTAHGGTVVDGGITWRAISPECCDGGAGYWLQVTVPRPTSLSITGVTQATTGVVTVGAVTGLANNRRIWIDGVVGMTQLNGRIWSMSSLGASTFNLNRDDSNGGANTTGFTAYVSGGVVLPFTQVSFSLQTALAKATSGWASGDRLRYSCEVVFEDVDVFRGCALVATITGGNTNGETVFSSNGSQGQTVKRLTAISDFMMPRPLSAASQTLDPTLNISLLSGTFRLAAPRLENRGAW